MKLLRCQFFVDASTRDIETVNYSPKSVTTGRPNGYYNPSATPQYPQANQSLYMPQQSQLGGQFNSQAPQQSSSPGNKFNQPSSASPGLFQPPRGHFMNGSGMGMPQQTAFLMYSPLDVPVSQPQSAFMQQTSFDLPSSFTPPLKFNIVPSVLLCLPQQRLLAGTFFHL